MSKKQVFALLFALLLFISAAALALTVDAAKWPVERSGSYSRLEEVAVYLATFEKLPENYLTKSEAQRLGWDNTRGNLWQVAPGCSIGGNRFGNYEGSVPEAKGRSWTECDIGYSGGRRGAKRLVFSNDGLIYYTEDHYRTFEEVNVVFPGKNGENPKTTVAPSSGKRPLLARVEVKKGESYTAWQEVASYLLRYHELPINYITLEEAKELGFSSKRDNMGEVAPEFSIGGGVFGNREGLLPAKEGRTWNECDVDMKADGKRGTHRLVYSNDGLVYLTRDKYKSFTEVKGE